MPITVGQYTVTDLNDGVDGTPSYTHIRYSVNANGNPMTTTTTGALYMGVAVSSSATAPTGYASYTWALIKGDKGEKGDPSPTYTWIKYADDNVGTNMVDVPEGKRFIGLAFNKTTATETTTAADYQWSPLYDNIQVGGRNLVVDSKNEIFNHVFYSGSTSTTTRVADTLSPYGEAVKMLTTARTSNYLFYFGTFKTVAPTMVVGEKYTVSFYIKADTAFSLSSVTINEVTVLSYKTRDIGTSYTRHEYVITPQVSPATAGNMNFHFFVPLTTTALNVPVYIHSLQVEKGNIATDWTAAPEDKENLYTWIKYATTITGTSLSDDPTGRDYIGIAYNKDSATKSLIAADYQWSLYRGDKGVKGDPGDNSISGVLSNDSHTVSTLSDGTGGVYTGAISTMSIFNGATNDSANWAVTVAVSGVTGSLVGKTYTVTNLTADTGYVDFTATRSGYASIVKRFTLTKSKQGATGGTGGVGSAATSYWLVASASAIGKSLAGAYSPTTFTVTGKAQTGTAAPVSYAGRFIISDSIDGVTFTDRYTSAANEATKVYTPLANIKAVRVEYFLAGGVTTLLDEQIIPIVVDGATGQTGGTGQPGDKGDPGVPGPEGMLNLVNNPHNTGNVTGWGSTTYGTSTFDDGRTIGVGNIISSGSAMATHNNFNIEPQKMYEFSVWLKQSVTKGTNYFGIYVYNAASANVGVYPISTVTGTKTATLNTNPYFWSGTVTANVWQKHTAYIIPAGYDTSDVNHFKNLGTNVTSVFQFPSDANKATMRVLNYSNTVSTTLSMGLPMVKEVDISVLEANKAKNINDLWRFGTTVEIDGGKLRANTVTATQINVAKLSALSADIGDITAGTITGVTMNATNMNLVNAGTFKATNTALGADTNFEIKDGLFSHAIGDSSSIFGFYDGDVDAVKGMYGNSSQGRIAFGSGYLFQAANGRMAFQKTVPSTLEAGGYWTDGGVETGYLWVKSTSDVSGTSSNTGIMVGNPSSGNLKMDWNEISAFGNGSPAELHVNPDGGRVVFNNNGVGGNLVIDGGEIVNQGRISPSLQNGWVNYGAAGGTYAIAGYWKDKNGIVHLGGLIKGGTTAVGTLILTLPLGYRPVGTYMFACHSPLAASYNTPRLDMGGDGRLTIQTATGSSWLSLAGITFKAE